jgi:hypothetical protein
LPTNAGNLIRESRAFMHAANKRRKNRTNKKTRAIAHAQPLLHNKKGAVHKKNPRWRTKKHTHDDGKEKREAILETKEWRDTSTGEPRQCRHTEEAIVIVAEPARASG